VTEHQLTVFISFVIALINAAVILLNTWFTYWIRVHLNEDRDVRNGHPASVPPPEGARGGGE
jgi:hypothetical protein